MRQFSINTNRTKGKGRVEKDAIVETYLQQTSGRFLLPNYSKLLDQRELYDKERKACTKFRLMLTIAPFCTNILFNRLTEIYHRGKNGKYTVVTDNTPLQSDLASQARGVNKPTREEMVQNTEYSNRKIGFEYHPGMDIFDNHLFRSNVFKMVNDWDTQGSGNENRKVFNTIQDHMRDSRKKPVTLYRRGGHNGQNVDEAQKVPNRHLYIRDDVMTYSDSINNNLMEENGWWGFVNPNRMDVKSFVSRQKGWQSMDINKVMNSNKPCEFIDMYPDRSLFSFNPKYNIYTHKPEYNWNVVVTYPFANDYSHELCSSQGHTDLYRFTSRGVGFQADKVNTDKVWTSLKIHSVSVETGVSGKPQVYFRTYTKHGLKRNDFIYLYYTIEGKEGFYESTRKFKVSGLGNSEKQHQDYYFSISDNAMLDELTMGEVTSSFYYADSYRVVAPFGTHSINDTITPQEYKTLGDKEKSYCVAEGRKNIQVADWIDSIADEDDYFFNLRSNGVEERTYFDFGKEDIYQSDGSLNLEMFDKEKLNTKEFRFCRVAGNTRSIYYLRKFMRMPNMKSVNRELTLQDVDNITNFGQYVQSNATRSSQTPKNRELDMNDISLFANEQYQLAFARSVYNDSVTQITFTDSIDIDKLKDNLGRPLTSLYYTFVKNNKGHKEWYEKQEYNSVDIEYSHCFGVVSSGLDLFHDPNDGTLVGAELEKWRRLGSVWSLANVEVDKEQPQNNPPKEVEGREQHALDYDINFMDNMFYGDLCELNTAECIETVLCDVMYRFNTAQRETVCNEHYSQYNYHEIISDDYDADGFKVGCYSVVNGEKATDSVDSVDEDGSSHDVKHDDKVYDYSSITVPEGYVYKAHYEIPIREWGVFNSDYHPTIDVASAKPVQDNGLIMIEIKSSLPHHLNKGDKVFVCDNTMGVWCVTECSGAPTPYVFRFVPRYTKYLLNHTDFEDKEKIINDSGEIPEDFSLYDDWLNMCEILNHSGNEDVKEFHQIEIKSENRNIPDYAMYGGMGSYNWRELQTVGDTRNRRVGDHVFANGYFYIPTHVNFFLERQCEKSNAGLDTSGGDIFPNDVAPLLKRRGSNNNTEEPEKEC